MPKPNIILIMTDNQQAATLGCYGNSEVQSPNIDALAQSGARFDQAFCPNAFCSPCRASVLTGLLPSQHGVHSWIDDRKRAEWPTGWHALAGIKTLPEHLQDAGYRTGIFGKYHLGDPCAPAPGWDDWVTMADGHVRSFYDNAIYDNGGQYPQPGHAVDFFTNKLLQFVSGSEKPYFAFLPLPAPYGHWPATNDGNRNRFAEIYDDCPIDSVPRQAVSAEAVRAYDLAKARSHGGLDFSMLMRAPNDLETLRNYYSQISLIDEAVGRIRAADPNATIIFTADHGMSLGHHGFWGHGAATYPSNLHHAAHSVPLIASGPSIEARTSRRMVSNLDIFSTIIELSGGTADPDLPSRSFADFLLGGNTPAGPDEVYGEQEETRVIRTPEWTYFKRFRGKDTERFDDALYDAQHDSGESLNLVQDPDHDGIATDLIRRIDTYFERFSVPKADLWRAGRPIQNSMRVNFWQDAWGPDWSPVMSYS